jgi:hypothetical protein
MLTRRAVCTGAPVVSMPSPLPLRPLKVAATWPSSSSSCMVLGVFRSTAVVSLWSLEKPGREAGGLVGGEMWVNPRDRESSAKCRPGHAGVLPALSEMSDVNGRRSAIVPRRARAPTTQSVAAWG